MHPRVSCTRLCGQQWIVCPLLWVYRVLAVPRGCRSKARFSSRRLVHRCVGRTEIVLIAEEVFRDSKLSAACMRQCHRPLRLHENTEETHRSCFFFLFLFWMLSSSQLHGVWEDSDFSADLIQVTCARPAVRVACKLKCIAGFSLPLGVMNSGTLRVLSAFILEIWNDYSWLLGTERSAYYLFVRISRTQPSFTVRFVYTLLCFKELCRQYFAHHFEANCLQYCLKWCDLGGMTSLPVKMS